MSRFHKTEHNTYQKYITWENKSYHIEIPYDIWNTVSHTCINSHVHYWKKHQMSPFKYGTITEVDDTPIYATDTCSICNKKYKTRSGLFRHIKTKHSSTTEPPSTESPSTAITTQNITNNNITNNIQNNITIRPFGKENPKWITERVIIDALRNIPGAIMNLVKEKHFNDRFPENRNVEMCSEFRNRYLTVQEETRKKVEDKHEMFMRMCNHACDAVTTTLESYSEPPDSDESEDEDESPEDRRCRQVASRIRQSTQLSSVVDRYIDKWQDYVSEVEHDEVLKKADHYITMLLLDLKLALAHEAESMNIRGVSE